MNNVISSVVPKVLAILALILGNIFPANKFITQRNEPIRLAPGISSSATPTPTYFKVLPIVVTLSPTPISATVTPSPTTPIPTLPIYSNSSPTPTVTPSPTATPTLTPTPIIASSNGLKIVFSYSIITSNVGDKPMKVFFLQNNSIIKVVNVQSTYQSDGLYIIRMENLTKGTFDIAIKSDRHLGQKKDNIVIGDGVTTIVFADPLLPGDFDGNELVNWDDFYILKAVYNKQGDYVADINYDGWVTIRDVSLMNRGWGQTGDLYYYLNNDTPTPTPTQFVAFITVAPTPTKVPPTPTPTSALLPTAYISPAITIAPTDFITPAVNLYPIDYISPTINLTPVTPTLTPIN